MPPAKRADMKKAKVALARELAVIMRRKCWSMEHCSLLPLWRPDRESSTDSGSTGHRRSQSGEPGDQHLRLARNPLLPHDLACPVHSRTLEYSNDTSIPAE